MTTSQWNALDWTLIAIVVLSVAAGFRRGLVRTVLGLAGFIGGFMLASLEYLRVADILTRSGWIESAATARVVAYLLIVAGVAVAAALIAGLIHRTVHAVGLSFVNRLLGAGFGLLRGWIAAMALLMIPAVLMPQSSLVATSVLYPYFFAGSHDVSFLVPQYLQHLTLKDSSVPARERRVR